MRILIIKLGALGDVVMATPLIEAIRQAHRGDAVVLLTTPPFAALFRSWPGLDVETRPRHGVGSMLRLLGWIRRQRFDRVYDLQSNDRSGLLCALSGIPERVGNHPRFPYTHHPDSAYTGQVHIFERMNEVLAAAGLDPAPARPHLPMSGSEARAVDDWTRARRLAAGEFAVVHAGASARRPAKRWPHFAELAGALAQRRLPVVWLGAAADAVHNRPLAAIHGIDATDAFSVPQLAGLAAQARFALANDSGPMHALAAAGIPVYALFGPSDWRRNHALGQAQYVLADPDLANITVTRVLSRLEADGVL